MLRAAFHRNAFMSTQTVTCGRRPDGGVRVWVPRSAPQKCLTNQIRNLKAWWEGDAMEDVRAGAKLADIERDHILATLASCEGNRTRAANALGISIRCLRNQLHLYAAA